MDAVARIDTPADTLAQLVLDATPRLAAVGSRTPRLDAEVLLAAACGTDRTALYAHARDRATPERRAVFETLLYRRIAGEPVQYIVGRQEFWSLDFIVTPDVLIPRPETELLVELALNAVPCPGHRPGMNSRAESDEAHSSGLPEAVGFEPTWHDSAGEFHSPASAERAATPPPEGARRQPITLCDLGTGSGCIAIALAHELPQAEIWALDTSEAALETATANARRHAIDDRVHFVHSDLFAAVGGMRFDVIVSNPPYVAAAELASLPPEVQREPRGALVGGADGLEVIRRVIAGTPAHLADGGWLIMEIGAGQESAVNELARAAGLRAVSVRPDYAGLPRALVARK
jgi:release factor glutamine methyltransferase